MAISEYLNIPGNIKQMYQPFVLDPANATMSTTPLIATYNESGSGPDSSIGGGANTLYFSFRPIVGKSDGVDFTESGIDQATNGSGFLKIMPASFYYDAYNNFNSDIANSLGYSNDKTSIDAKSILRTIPFISVREYLQDSKLNLLMSILGAISKAWQSAIEISKRTEGFSFVETAEIVWKGIKNVVTDGTFENIILEAIKSIDTTDSSSWHASGDINERYNAFVLNFPYILYYRLISTTSLNIYELPYNGKILWESSGGGFGNGIFGGVSMGEDSNIGLFVNWIGKNLKINTSPTWDGPNDLPVKVDIDFSLYNDTIDGAVKNYIFLTTLLANNKWMQYHMFLHAPCVYDVKIPGINRLFMCLAQIKVELRGVLRNPSIYGLTEKKLTDVISILNDHINRSRLDLDDSQLRENYNIRIPDVYDVHITFTSLLPNNFNNHMFLFYKNDKISPMSGTNVYLSGFYNMIFNNVFKETINAIKGEISYQTAVASAKKAAANPTNNIIDQFKEYGQAVIDNYDEALKNSVTWRKGITGDGSNLGISTKAYSYDLYKSLADAYSFGKLQ